MPVSVSLLDLAEIHKISDSKLAKWRKEGVDVFDTRSVVTRIWGLRRKPPEWIPTFGKLTDGGESGTHEAAKKLKTEAEVKRLNLINERLAGDSYAKADCDEIMAAWMAALSLGFTEMQAMLPPQLEGLTAAKIEVELSDALHNLRENLSNLSSDLWERVYQSATPDENQSPATNGKSHTKTNK